MVKGKFVLVFVLKKKIGSNDEIQKVIYWIDIGFLLLNKVIFGCYDGGFLCGCIVEVFGFLSVGKCVIVDIMLLMECGMVIVKELFEIEGYKVICIICDVEYNVGFINENGVIEKILYLIWNNCCKFKCIKLVLGGYIEVMFCYLICVVDDLGNVVW